ncbi:MAG: hypothetical protein OHK0046_01660 [Anaerolineae bacterium]
MQEISGQKHNQAERSRLSLWVVALPVVLVGFILVALVLIVFVPRSSPQISIIADFVLICFTLFPLVICVSPLFLLIMAAAFGVGSLLNTTEKLLIRLKGLTQSVLTRTENVSANLNRRSIGLAASLAFLDRIFEKRENRHE